MCSEQLLEESDLLKCTHMHQRSSRHSKLFSSFPYSFHHHQMQMPDFLLLLTTCTSNSLVYFHISPQTTSCTYPINHTFQGTISICQIHHTMMQVYSMAFGISNTQVYHGHDRLSQIKYGPLHFKV